jgi:Glycosyl transferases group 1
MSSPSAEDAIILLGNVPFRSCQQRAQHLARAMARTRNVIYVEPNRSFLHRPGRRAVQIECAPEPSGPMLVRPPSGLPFARSVPRFHRLNCWFSAARTSEFVRRRGLRIRALIATFPDQLPLVRQLSPVPLLVYDIMDDFTLFLRPWQRPRFAAWHRALLEEAGLVTVSSGVLWREHVARARRVELLGNAIQAGLPDQCLRAVRAPELAALPQPRLGYLGMISQWFDFSAVAALARAWPQGSVILIGPRDVTPPPLPANVHLLPAVREHDVPSVLRSFDVGLIPFRRDSRIDAVNPIKMFEYLAAGLPVVSADFKSVRGFEGLVRRYCDPASAVVEVAAALHETTTSRRVEERRAFAARHTWEDRAAQLLGWIDSGSFGRTWQKQLCHLFDQIPVQVLEQHEG